VSRVYRRYKRDADGRLVTTPDGMSVEIETVVERLCACSCGNRWLAEAGTTTRCDGGRARFRCPVGDEPFEVPAS
jgi:hypothetical protein